jgi:hypothetical protein
MRLNFIKLQVKNKKLFLPKFIKIMRLITFFYLLTICSCIFFSCQKEKQGSIEFNFTHTVDEQPIELNQLIYINAAGNRYQLNEVKYFISSLFLIDTAGRWIAVKQDDGVHYVDLSLENTLCWKIAEMPQRHYTKISFVFGLNENDNQSNRFVNPPECNFSWPKNLGGGYHYMQLNGKFLNDTEEIQNLNIHTGIGQIHYDKPDTTVFVPNYFTVTLPVSFFVNEEKTTLLNINMEIQRWFDTPNLYNFNEYGTGIMQNQKAQELLRENGKNAFDVMM